jgi:alpha-galactosidase
LTKTTTVKAAAFATAGGVVERSPVVAATYVARKLGPDHDVSLSDLPPVDVFAHGGLKKDVKYSGGGPCVLGGKPFAKSLLHPEQTPDGGRSRATFVLTGGLQRAKRFTATVGVEAEVGKRGSTTFAVEVRSGGTWKRVFESGVLRGGDPPKRVEVPLTNVEAIRLVCTDAGDGLDCDHAVWGAPLLQ